MIFGATACDEVRRLGARGLSSKPEALRRGGLGLESKDEEGGRMKNTASAFCLHPSAFLDSSRPDLAGEVVGEVDEGAPQHGESVADAVDVVVVVERDHFGAEGSRRERESRRGGPP